MNVLISPDTWTLDDKLGFRRYVESLSSILTTAETPLTVGVFGGWGTGKTSLMRMLQTQVSPELKTIWFDAWKYAKEDVLWRSLLLTVLESIKDEATTTQDNAAIHELSELEDNLFRDVEVQKDGGVSLDLGELIKSVGMASVRVSLSLIPGWGVLSELVKATQKDSASSLQGIFDAIKRQQTNVHKSRIQFLDQFQKVFGSVIHEQFVKRNRRLIVIVDDLDRCLPEKSVEVLEAIKLFLDVPGCIFVMGVDHDVIAESVKQFYNFPQISSEAGDAGSITGANYLEKIIQLPFYLPPLEKTNIKEYVHSLLSGINIDDGVTEAFLAGIEPNPRKIKRTINTFLFLKALSESQSLHNMIDYELLAKIVIIQQRYGATLYKDLTTYPVLLVDLEKYFEEQSQIDHIRAIALSAKTPESAEQRDESQPIHNLRINVTTLITKYMANKNLRLLLLSGKRRFKDNSLGAYIYLTEATSRITRTNMESFFEAKIWEDLFSNDATRIKQAIDSIDQSESDAYIKSLAFVVGDVFRDLKTRASSGMALGYLGDPRLSMTARIPKGSFQMGSSLELVKALGSKQNTHLMDRLDWETEIHDVILNEFEIDVYPVTNKQYEKFIIETGRHPPLFWKSNKFLEGTANQPVVGVSWFDAIDYAKWAGKRLPTEAEWEKAARGGDAREWPWGNEFDATCCNTNVAKAGTVMPVGIYPQNRSPFGVFDMAGNVWEWTSSLYTRYPYDPDDGRENLKSDGPRVMRGGSFFHDATNARCAFRNAVLPDIRNEFIGFRCCKDVVSI